MNPIQTGLVWSSGIWRWGRGRGRGRAFEATACKYPLRSPTWKADVILPSWIRHLGFHDFHKPLEKKVFENSCRVDLGHNCAVVTAYRHIHITPRSTLWSYSYEGHLSVTYIEVRWFQCASLMPPSQFLQVTSKAKRIIQRGYSILHSFHDALGVTIQRARVFKFCWINVFELWKQSLIVGIRIEKSEKAKRKPYTHIQTSIYLS